VAVLSLAVVTAACSDNPVAPAPSQPPSQPPPFPSPRPPGPTSASLLIEDFSVIVKRSLPGGRAVEDGRFSLEVRFLLKETSGNSGANVESFFLGDQSGGGAWFAGSCLKGLRVPAGGVYDTLNTDEGYASWSYCAPYWGVVSAPVKEMPIFLTVNFVDDDGHPGSVRAQAVWKYYTD
jgi:hypothetical protein